MPLVLITLLEPSDVHEVEPLTEGFMIRARPGKARPFSEIVRRLHELDNDCAVFAQADGKGGYEAAHVIPFD